MPEKLPPTSEPVNGAVQFSQRTARTAGRHDLYSIFALVAFAIVFAGFARTFFLRFLFASPKMPLYLYLHGLLFSGWFALFFIQSRLIASHRVDLHRRLGMVGVGFAGLAVCVAIIVAVRAGERVYKTQSKPFSLKLRLWRWILGRA